MSEKPIQLKPTTTILNSKTHEKLVTEKPAVVVATKKVEKEKPKKTEKKEIPTGPFYDIKILNGGMMDGNTMEVFVTFLHKVTDKQELQMYFDAITAVYTRNKPFLITFYAPSIEQESLGTLKQLTSFMKTKEEDSKRLMLACAVVILNSTLLTLAKPIILFKTPICPFDFCNSLEKATIFLRNHDPLKKPKQ